MANLKIFLDKTLNFLYNICINNQKLSIFFKEKQNGSNISTIYRQSASITC